MSNFEAITVFRDSMKDLYDAASVEHEKQFTVNVNFTHLLIDNFKDTIFTFKSMQTDSHNSFYGFCYQFIRSNDKDGIIRNINYSKIPYYLELRNISTKRCIRMFVSPLDVSKVYIGCYSLFQPNEGSRISKNALGPDELIVDMRHFNNTTVIFSLGEFLVGEIEAINFANVEITTHGKIH